LLRNFALVMPRSEDRRLRGMHLFSLAAFLDKRFRDYDFRRGAADARKAATEVLQISYDAGRPAGFYAPDDDPLLTADLTTYDGLNMIASSRDPKRSVRQVFEDALDKRLDALVRHWNPPGPDLLYDLPLSVLVKHLVHEQLPTVWGV
jgi:hypothetical protein